MFNESDFIAAQSSAETQLQEAQAAVARLALPSTERVVINLQDDLNPERLDELLKKFPAGYAKRYDHSDFIYVIQLEDHNQQQLNELSTGLREARKSADDYARVNPDHHCTQTIYVGRSRTLRQRMNQHFGADHNGTFALHLSRWAQDIEAALVVCFTEFVGLDDLVVQAIEDGIWETLSPAFGKKGAR